MPSTTTDANRFRLLHGPYQSPNVEPGQTLRCEIRGRLTAGRFNDPNRLGAGVPSGKADRVRWAGCQLSSMIGRSGIVDLLKTNQRAFPRFLRWRIGAAASILQLPQPMPQFVVETNYQLASTVITVERQRRPTVITVDSGSTRLSSKTSLVFRGGTWPRQRPTSSMRKAQIIFAKEKKRIGLRCAISLISGLRFTVFGG